MAEEQLNPVALTAVRKVPGTRAQAIAYIHNGAGRHSPINETQAGRFVQVFNGWQSVMCDDGELTVSQVEVASWAPVKPVFAERRETARNGEERREWLGDQALAVLADLVKHRSGKGIAGGEAHEQRWQELWWMAEAIVKLRERCTDKAEGGAP